jgi:hypothetical protein
VNNKFDDWTENWKWSWNFTLESIFYYVIIDNIYFGNCGKVKIEENYYVAFIFVDSLTNILLANVIT